MIMIAVQEPTSFKVLFNILSLRSTSMPESFCVCRFVRIVAGGGPQIPYSLLTLMGKGQGIYNKTIQILKYLKI